MNLVYYLLYGDDIKYFNMLKLSILTLVKNGNYKGDILIITDNINDRIKEIDIDNNVYVMVSNMNDFNGTKSLFRYYIFNFEFIDNYDKILYIDTDVLISKDINHIFSINKGEFNFSIETYKKGLNDLCSAYYLLGDKLYREIGDNIIINAGIFLFDNNEKNINICKEIFNSNCNGSCQDQPIVNKYFLLNKNDFNGDLTEHVLFNFRLSYIPYNNDYTFIHNLAFDDASMETYMEFGNYILDNNLSFDFFNKFLSLPNKTKQKEYGVVTYVKWENNTINIKINKDSYLFISIFRYRDDTNDYESIYNRYTMVSSSSIHWYKPAAEFGKSVMVIITIDNIVVDKKVFIKE
jgi:hypothetical protein